LAYRNYEENLLEQPYQSAALVGGASYGIGQLAGQGALGAGAQQSGSFLGSIGKGSPFSSLGFGKEAAAAGEKNIFQKLIGEKAQKDALGNVVKEGSGFRGMGTAEKIFTASAALPLVENLFGGEEEAPKPAFTEEDYKKAYAEQAAKLQGAFHTRKLFRWYYILRTTIYIHL
jgi:hypothetical protein